MLLWNSLFNKTVNILGLVKSTAAIKCDSGLGEEISVFFKALAATPASYSMGVRHFFLRCREGDHSLASSAKVKNGWNYITFPPFATMAYILMCTVTVN